MTFWVQDTTPDTWHKVEFSSSYLLVVDNYISENNVVAKISGAVSIGVMGPSTSTVSFESKEEFEKFEAWFAENKGESFVGIAIATNTADRELRGSKVETLPKGN